MSFTLVMDLHCTNKHASSFSPFRLKEITAKIPPEICESESIKAVRSQIYSFLDTVRTQASEPESTSEDHNDAARVRNSSQSVDGTPQECNGSSVSDTSCKSIKYRRYI